VLHAGDGRQRPGRVGHLSCEGDWEECKGHSTLPSHSVKADPKACTTRGFVLFQQ
jgi:hypothetical protein